MQFLGLLWMYHNAGRSLNSECDITIFIRQTKCREFAIKECVFRGERSDQVQALLT